MTPPVQRVLVTGATGFVGKHLCQTLIARGFPLVAAIRDASKRRALPPAAEAIMVGEIGPETDWNEALARDIDCVIHLAGRAHVLDESGIDSPAEFRRVNVAGTKRLAEATAGRARRLIYVSSVHAICSLNEQVLDESSPCRPDSPYGVSKWQAEQAVAEVGARTGLEIVIVRPPPVYGPGNMGNLVKLFRAVARGWPLPLGNIANQRSLIYVKNLTDALCACIAPDAANGQTFLVSDGEDLSISDLIRRASAALGRPAKLVSAPAGLLRAVAKLSGKSAAVERLLGSLAVDSGKIRRLLAWHPPHAMADGLSATARWMRSNV